jgi:photosystem II stability/assembly factor-like uncharacterized protein
MKKFLTVIMLLFAVTYASFSDGFNSVYSSNGTFVIAIGDGGNCWMSQNGGASFGSYPIPGGFNFNGVHGSGTRVIVVGDAGAVQVSANTGASFTNNGIGGADLNGVWMVDANTGWAVGNGGRIVKTTNGGAAWTPQTSGTPNNLTDVKFTSLTNGVACGDLGTVVYTVNGGTSWLTYTTGSTRNLLSIDASGSTIIATAVDGYILKYNGSVWSAINYKSVVKPDVRGVSMIDANTFYTCGGGGFINKTTDAGVTRTYQQNPMQAPLKDIYFQSSANGWSVSSTNNAILRTADGGATWSFQSGVSVTKTYIRKQNTSGNIGNPFCIHPQNKNGMFILAGSQLYRSLDKGDTWTLLNGSVPGGQCHSFFVNELDTNLMIASKGTSGGRVIGSTNYGATWYDIINPINLTSYGMPMEVDPNNPNTVYVAPDNGALRKSTNWGANWTTLGGRPGSGTFRSPCDVVIQYENPNVIFIGDGVTSSSEEGEFYKSTDGGLTFVLIHTNPNGGSEIPMIANTSLDLNLVYHTTWSTGSFWKSTSQGSSFSDLNKTGSLWATDIAKDDPTTITYNTYSGTTSYLSLDNSANFQTINTTSSPGAGILFFDKANLLYQQGSGVDKLQITYTVTSITGNTQISSEIPKSFGLSQNYPNPFNPTTQIKYDVAKASYVSIKIFDILGNEVAMVVSGNLTAGKYSADFDASSLATGLYFYSLVVDGQKIDTKKMMLVK